MKIVINHCFGGFSLSPLAVRRLAELRGQPCFLFTDSNGTKPLTQDQIDNGGGMFWTAFNVPNPSEIHPKLSIGEWAKMTDAQRAEHNAAFDRIHLDSRPNDRTDPILIQVVEELGDKANGSCASLKIVEIPDDVKWQIDEYDGHESIHEEHRSWP